MNSSDFSSTPSSEVRYVSTAQVARALGVSVTTVKRWVDDDILPAHRTVGGHRKLLLSDVLRLAREENFPQADLASLMPRVHALSREEPERIRQQLLQAVSQFDTPLVRAVIHGAYQNGYSIEQLADWVIAPVMVQIGHDWAVGRVDVSHEHRATQSVVTALYELSNSLRSEGLPGRPTALGGAPEHDHYMLASLLCKMVLVDAGWDVVHLGPHTPMSAFIASIERLRPRLVWLSVTHLQDPDQFVSEYRDLHRVAEEYGTAIAIGGRGLIEPIRQRMNYTTFGDGLMQLAAFARSLYRPPTRPKRGRPAGSGRHLPEDVSPNEAESET